MKFLRFSPLFGLSALLIAQAAFMQPTQATEATPAATDDLVMKLEFHPIRASAASKRSGDGLKPNINNAEFFPVDAELRMHAHADGTVSYDCNENHDAAGKHAASQPESGS